MNSQISIKLVLTAPSLVLHIERDFTDTVALNSETELLLKTIGIAFDILKQDAARKQGSAIELDVEKPAFLKKIMD